MILTILSQGLFLENRLLPPRVLLDNRRYMVSRVLSVFLAVFCAVAAADVKVLEQIVAKVNGDIITRGELERGRPSLKEELKQHNAPPARMQELLTQKEADALRDQVDALLLVQKAKELNIDVEAEV